MTKKNMRRHLSGVTSGAQSATATIEVSARRFGNSLGWAVPAPVVRSHHLEAGSRGTMHVERDARRRVVRYVIEVREDATRERPRHPISWYLERAAARGLGKRLPEELLPADAPKLGEIW